VNRQQASILSMEKRGEGGEREGGVVEGIFRALPFPSGKRKKGRGGNPH